jgi:hypothetical protein
MRDDGFTIYMPPLEMGGRYMTLGEQHEDGARRYREHAARQTAEGKPDHAACSLRKAEHKERMAANYRALFSRY